MLAGFTNVTFEFGARVIVQDATWHIQPNERIGLIGYNGTGKSTLLKLLVGEYSASAGTVERGKNVTIGFLHQDLLSLENNKSILEVAKDAFETARSIQTEMEAVEAALHTDSHNAQLLDRYAHLLHDFQEAGGYEMDHKSAEVLAGLGFESSQMQKPFTQFSGGWRMRVLLAKMILQQPDILLLDEPTNHLDLPSIEWLEKYLQHYPGSVVIVSHDKFFLNRMVNRIVELYQQELFLYTGNYDFYEREKVERIALQKRSFENQQDYIRQQERFIERFRSKASKAAQAQSAIKRLEKLERVENAELERPDIKINFSVETQPGRTLCSLKNISKQFGPVQVLENTGIEIYRGDKIALIGANGKGKSTLLRIIAGAESFTGERVWGHNVKESFYAQHQLEALQVKNTVLEEMSESRAGKTELEYRSLLGCFLFSGDDVEKKISVLSGGEKARVALAKTIVSKANFLMLDEPTNHLDMHSVELLSEALNRYQGSFVLVSHDRYFISKTANTFWEIYDKKIREFRGTYEEFMIWREKKSAEEALAISSTSTPEPAIPVPPPVKPNRAINKEAQRDLQKVQKAFDRAEELVEQLKLEKSRCEVRLADPTVYADKQRFLEAEMQYKEVTEKLKQAEIAYEASFEALMEAQTNEV